MKDWHDVTAANAPTACDEHSYRYKDFPMLNNFVAIDFETANQKRSSVCSVGIVVVENHVVVDKYYSLIHPTPNYYQSINISVHGLTDKDTADAPMFPEVWADILPRIKNYPLVAHNAPFDQSCLREVHAAYGMRYPSYQFYCTCRAARAELPMLPNHRLKTVALHCGFDLTHHHHALADAEACAHIALRLL